MTLLEHLARTLCISEGVDPDHMCAGLGINIPRGESWTAWKVRVKHVERVIYAEAEWEVQQQGGLL
jgi:hypothetical protein